MSGLLDSQLRRSLAILDRDLLRDLRCALIAAVDDEGMTDEALSAALRERGLVISREPPKAKAKPYFIEVR